MFHDEQDLSAAFNKKTSFFAKDVFLITWFVPIRQEA